MKNIALLLALLVLGFAAKLDAATVTASYSSAADVPVTAASYTATGNTVNFNLNYAPVAGTIFTVVKNTGIDFIQGTFDNLAQGQAVTLSYNGINYSFVANYYGGTGNDLVLQWANTVLVGWGLSLNGQLGNNSTVNRNVPAAITASGVLSGKTVVSMSGGVFFGLALCSDGTVAAWGSNTYGQLGTNSTTDSLVPVAVNMSGALSGKTVIAITAGDYYSMALCSDGTVFAWGLNNYGQLGNNSTTDSWVPVAVTTSGVLSGKTVVVIAAGQYDSLALCSDGTVATWGRNSNGQLGNNSTTNSSVPVAVTTSGVLSGKTVAAIAAGGVHSLALCTDGTLVTWGLNANGQLGNNSTTDSSVPVAVTTSGVLLGKTVVSMSGGAWHSLVICSDGTVAAWGINSLGQLGVNNSYSLTQSVPITVPLSGALSGKTVVSVSGGVYQSVALCSDGTVAAWGSNSAGQLGDGTTNNTGYVPEAVTTTSFGPGIRFALAGTDASSSFNLALVASLSGSPIITSALAANNLTGLPFSYTVTASSSPTTYGATSLPAGLTIDTSTGLIFGTVVTKGTYTVHLSATNPGGTGTTSVVFDIEPFTITSATTATAVGGTPFSYAMTTFGPAASYGATGLPAGLTIDTSTGLISGTPTVLGTFNVTLSATNTDVGTTTASLTLTVGPLAITSAATASAVMGSPFSYTIKASGSVTSYGATNLPAGLTLDTSSGVISGMPSVSGTFNVTLSATNPIAGTATKTLTLTVTPFVITSATTASDVAGTPFSYAIVATGSPTSYGATGLPTGLTINTATGVISGTPTVSGTFNIALSATNPGATTTSTLTLTVAPFVITSATTASDAVGTPFNYAIVATGSPTSYGATSLPAGLTINTSTGLISGTPTVSGTFNVTLSATNPGATATSTLTLTVAPFVITSPTTANGLIGSVINYAITASSPPVSYEATGLPAGLTINTATGLISGLSNATGTFNITLSATNSLATTVTSPLTLTVTASYLTAIYNSATDVPLTTSSVNATGISINITLNYAPITGTNLTVVKNTGPAFIQGAFSNLAQGQIVPLSYGGVTYNFRANYYGGTGRDLVLQWADTRPVAWGFNFNGPLGIGNGVQSNVPAAVITSGVLSGKTVIAMAAGDTHSLALCSDGTLAAWGYNNDGQLGNNSTTNSNVPVAVTMSGALSGKTVIAVSAGLSFSLALCSDGTVAAWGYNGNGLDGSGQLGNNSTIIYSSVPVAVTTSGVLSGKTVVAISAGGLHCLALCSDGTVATWGNNSNGQLGNNSTTNSNVPVLVTTSGVLSSKTVIAVSGGQIHSLALCSDGTVVAWGYNGTGQLGNNSTTGKSSPVAVITSGALSGKKAIAVSAGTIDSLAFCSDGTMVTWGSNDSGALGNDSIANGTTVPVPVTVTTSGALSGKAVIAVSSGSAHDLALCSDGTVAAWGSNQYGQLGNNSTTDSSVPVAVTTTSLASGEKFAMVTSGSVAQHSHALVAEPVPGITSAAVASAFTGNSFNYAITASGLPTSFGATGLPAGLTLNTTSGLISGAPTQAGTFNVTLSAANLAGTATSTLTLTVITPQTFSQWETSYSITSDPTATPQNDGVSNLLKYLFDLNPTVPMSATDRAALPATAKTTIGGSQYLTLTYRQNASMTGITVNVQTSPDLQNWTTVTPDFTNNLGSDPTIPGDSDIQVEVNTAGASKKFIRLSVTMP